MASIVTARESSVRLLDADAMEFREKFDQRCFEFSHRLSDHPLFQIPRLLELARSTHSRPGDLYYDMGDIAIGQRWDHTPPRSLSVEQCIQQLERAGAWIILKRAERDPDYRPLLEQCIAEMQEMSGRDLQKAMKVQEVIVFIASPGRITSYHIDRECNCLLQIRGQKTINIFDRNDRELLPEPELERFWTMDSNAAVYRPGFQNRASVYHLTPGTGVHIPVNAPHWLKNGDDICVTVSFNFQFHDWYRANTYRANYFLRKAGIRPTPPGESPWRDSLKRSAIGGAISIRNLLRKTARRRTLLSRR
jgi:hypothetical protein